MIARLSFSFRAPRVVRAAWVTALCAITLSISATSSHAMRHLKLTKTFPSKDTTVTVSPSAIKLWLSEPADLAASKISLSSVTGTPVALAKLSREPNKGAPIEAKLIKPIPPGMYVVTWKAMSKDGHVINGAYGFLVAMAIGKK